MKIIPMFLLFFVFGCNQKSQSDSPNNTQAGNATGQATTYSCALIVNGQPSRCMEYSASLGQQILDASKSTCGNESQGLKGFSWVQQACPTVNKLVECIPNTNNQAFRNFFYSPSYTKDSANSVCQGMDGHLN